jgi:anhydro-N-acetylmuramic acid kinase
MNLYIGLMSGTSIDGIDAVCARIEQGSITLIETLSHDFTPELAALLHQLCEGGAADEVQLQAQASVALASAYGHICQALLKRAQLTPAHIRAIGCHGQTIRHFPALGYTLQIGSPAHLAAATGIDVIADFRTMDMALGGQGAPLVPAFHQACFANENRPRYILNLGGIANVTCLIPDQPLLGYDTGPANTLLDHWYRKHHHDMNFDQDAGWAKQGVIHTELLGRLMRCDYLSQLPPKSTGRELFSPNWLTLQLEGLAIQNPADVQCTLTEFSALSAALAIQSHGEQGEVYLCGGGAYNPLLVERLKAHLPHHHHGTTQDLGISPQWVEASAFAWLAHRHIERLPGNAPSVTGASRPAILGALYPAL